MLLCWSAADNGKCQTQSFCIVHIFNGELGQNTVKIAEVWLLRLLRQPLFLLRGGGLLYLETARAACTVGSLCLCREERVDEWGCEITIPKLESRGGKLEATGCQCRYTVSQINTMPLVRGCFYDQCLCWVSSRIAFDKYDTEPCFLTGRGSQNLIQIKLAHTNHDRRHLGLKELSQL